MCLLSLLIILIHPKLISTNIFLKENPNIWRVVYVWAYIYTFFNTFVSFLVFVGAGGGCGGPAEGAPVEGRS